MIGKKLITKIEGIEKMIKELSNAISSNINKDIMLDTLYKKYESYEENLLYKIEKNFILDLIYLYDCVISQKKYLKENLHMNILGNTRIEFIHHIDMVFNLIIKEVLEILSKYNIELIETTDNKLNSEYQKVVRVVETKNKTEDKEVMEIIKDGFRSDKKIIRPQEVCVKIYKEGGLIVWKTIKQ